MPAQENTSPLSDINIADIEVSFDQLIAVALQGEQVKISSDPAGPAKLRIYPA